MVGPLVYDLAKQHVTELLAEREMDRLAAQLTREHRSWLPKIDVRRLLPPARPSMGAATA